MAKINTRKKGNNWEYYFEIAKVEGKRKRISKAGFRTKKDALEAGNKALTEYNDFGVVSDKCKITIADFAKDEYIDYINSKYMGRTAEAKIRSLDFFVQTYGTVTISKFDYKHAEQYVSKLIKRGLAKNTIHTYVINAKRMFEYAVLTHVINFNPFTNVKEPTHTANQGYPNEVYSDERIKKYLEAYKDTPLEAVIMLGYHCGLRISEMCALTWNDVDFKKKKLTINKQLYRPKGKNFFFATPKYSSSRVIDLDSEIIEYLKELKIKKESVPLRYTYSIGENQRIIGGYDFSFIVSRDDSKIMSIENIHGRLSRMRIEKDPLRPHSLRHTHCSKLVAAGFDMKYIQQRMGHKSVRTTLDVYTHLTDQTAEECASKLDSIWV